MHSVSLNLKVSSCTGLLERVKPSWLVPSHITRIVGSSGCRDQNWYRSTLEKVREWSVSFRFYLLLVQLSKIHTSFRDLLQVRELFVMAREHAPSIIFMDEIDSIGSSRGGSGSGGGDSEVQRTMLELLNQLDGFEATKNIKVSFSASRLGPVQAKESR